MEKKDRKESDKRYREKHKEEIARKKKEYDMANIELTRERKKRWREKNKNQIVKKFDSTTYNKNYYEKNKERIKMQRAEKSKLYSESNKETIRVRRNNYVKSRREADPLFKLKENIKTNIRKCLTKQGFTKKSKTYEILGCSYDEFKTHIESLWEPWMNWDNYGLYNGELNYGWDLDHIIPTSTGLTEEDIIALNHYTNLQPLCSKVNRDIKKDNTIH